MGDLIPLIDIEKPAFGSPCNGCGYCCFEGVCHIGKVALPQAIAPCPFLLFIEKDQRYFCKLVLIEAESDLPKMVASSLGIGKGCDADY